MRNAIGDASIVDTDTGLHGDASMGGSGSADNLDASVADASKGDALTTSAGDASSDRFGGAGSFDASVGGSATEAVTYQINVAHTGAQPYDTIRLPLEQRWSFDFGQAFSYPVVAGGRVFVTVRNPSNYGTQLLALDAANGVVLWGPIAIDGTYFWSNAAYDNGRIFVVNFDGVLSAYEAVTGNKAWAVQMPGQYAFSSPPTASRGRVYVGGAGSGGTVYAVDGTDGNVVWSAPVANGDHSSPALSESGLFVSYACNQAYGFEMSGGSLLWHHSTGCSGGGGKTVMFYAGTVYTRDYFGDLLLNANDGSQVGSFNADYIPAAANGTVYAVNNGTLSAVELGSPSPTKWEFGNGTVTAAPIVVGDTVVVGASTELFVLDTSTGSVVGQRTLPATIPTPDEQNVSQPLTGLAAAEDKLFVPAGTRLVAY